MRSFRRFAARVLSLVLLTAACAEAANPFLQARDDKPVSANFRGTEWGDLLGPDDLPLRAKVVTTKIAMLPWGEIFQIEFRDIASQAEEKREIGPDLFLVTDSRIVLFSAEDLKAEIQKLSALPTPPEFAPRDVVGISRGSFVHKEEDHEGSTIKVNGDLCTYQYRHNSGHSMRYVWRRGVGLVEVTYNYGARGDGYTLKRVVPSSRR